MAEASGGLSAEQQARRASGVERGPAASRAPSPPTVRTQPASTQHPPGSDTACARHRLRTRPAATPQALGSDTAATGAAPPPQPPAHLCRPDRVELHRGAASLPPFGLNLSKALACRRRSASDRRARAERPPRCGAGLTRSVRSDMPIQCARSGSPDGRFSPAYCSGRQASRSWRANSFGRRAGFSSLSFPSRQSPSAQPLASSSSWRCSFAGLAPDRFSGRGASSAARALRKGQVPAMFHPAL